LHDLLDYFFFACARADPAADFDAALVLRSLSTADAAVAAFREVTFGGDTWDSELPAALLDALPVEALESTPEDLLATLELVTFLAMKHTCTTAVNTVAGLFKLGNRQS
jgi:hypothetical protein